MTVRPQIQEATGEPQEQKRCTKCQQLKDLCEFYKDSRYKLGVPSWCKSCVSNRSNDWNKSNREQVKRTRYGVDFNRLWAQQAGLCAVCNEPMVPKGKDPNSVVIDHDHNCCEGQSS